MKPTLRISSQWSRHSKKGAVVMAALLLLAAAMVGEFLVLRGPAHSRAGATHTARLTIDKFGEGMLLSRPRGIECGADCADQSLEVSVGTKVQLTATASVGSVISSWTGCDEVSAETCTVRVDADRSVLVTFAYDQLKLAPRARTLGDDVMRYLKANDGGALYFDSKATSVAALQPSDVIFSDVGAGLLRKVTGVHVTPDFVIVTTDPALITEAVERGTIVLHRTLTNADLATSSPASEARGGRLASPSAFGLTLPIHADLAPGVTVDGTDSMEITPDIAVAIDGFTVRELRAFLTYRDQGHVTFTAQAGFHSNPSTKVSYPFGAILGFVLSLDMEVGATVDLSTAAQLEASWSPNGDAPTITVGEHWLQGSGWQPSVSSFSRPYVSISPPQLTAAANIKAYVRPGLSASFAGVVGPYFKLEGYLRLAADPAANPWWVLFGGIGGGAGFQAQIPLLGTSISELKLISTNSEWEITHAPGAFGLTSPGPSSSSAVPPTPLSPPGYITPSPAPRTPAVPPPPTVIVDRPPTWSPPLSPTVHLTPSPAPPTPVPTMPPPTPIPPPTPLSGPGSPGCPTLVGGNWSGTWHSSYSAASGTWSGPVTVTNGEISGYITIYGSPLFSGGFVSGSVSCDRVVFGTVNGQISFVGTLSADGHSASGTYSAPSAPDSGTWTGAF